MCAQWTKSRYSGQVKISRPPDFQSTNSRLVLSRWRGGRCRVACLRGACLEYSQDDIECEPKGGSHDKPKTADVGGTPAPQLFTIDDSRLHSRSQTVRRAF